MGYITVPARENVESAQIYYKDWGTGPVVERPDVVGEGLIDVAERLILAEGSGA